MSHGGLNRHRVRPGFGNRWTLAQSSRSRRKLSSLRSDLFSI